MLNVQTEEPNYALNNPDATDEWNTPPWITALVRDVLGTIDLDPCGNKRSSPVVRATRILTVETDGLKVPWSGRVFMNPPYTRGQLAQWSQKLVSEYRTGAVTQAIALVPAYTDTSWWKTFAPYPVCFLHGRVKFDGASGYPARFPSALIYLGTRTARFIFSFRAHGTVYLPI